MRSVRFITFGCKANQYDTQVLREALLRRGLEESEQESDLVVVNTCTVTEDAARKAQSLIRRLHRDNPATQVCVTGCLAESEPHLLSELPGVRWVLGNGEAKRPASFLRQLGFEHDPEELGIPAGITEFAGHTRAFVKIQDGCDHACAFCIIPSVRGRSRSRPIAELAQELRALVRLGYYEIVLCGIHIGDWGKDLGLRLADLLQALVALDQGEAGAPWNYRLRLSSIEATEVDEPLLEVMALHPTRIAPHLHMPLQSGDDGILARMRRWYRMEEYERACERIALALDRPAFTADLLVGFPGEDERAFENSLAAARRIGFARLHVFPFSARGGTAAATLSPAVPLQQIRERRAAAAELSHLLGNQYRHQLDGTHDTLNLEAFVGLSGRYQRVRVPTGELLGPLPNALQVRLEARADALGDVELLGHPLACSELSR